MRRDTYQREAIRKALLYAGRPLSIREIFELAQREVSGLGIATVYRNLRELQEEEKIVQVDLPGQPSRWEASLKGHHHHFLCRTCDKLLEVPKCPEGIIHLLPEGYTLEEHDILLHGTCDLCAKNTTAHEKEKCLKKN